MKQSKIFIHRRKSYETQKFSCKVWKQYGGFGIDGGGDAVRV